MTCRRFVFRNRLPTFVLVIAVSFPAIGQSDISFEFGKLSAGAVRVAHWIDYYENKCLKSQVRPYTNLTDLMLKSCKRSVSGVVESGARAGGMTSNQLLARISAETEETINRLGGCTSPQTKSWVEEAKATHVAHIEALHRICP
jgi:hypothetical protein